jgi:hypothetical protein
MYQSKFIATLCILLDPFLVSIQLYLLLLTYLITLKVIIIIINKKLTEI